MPGETTRSAGGGFGAGVALPVAALRFLFAHPGLLGLALVPAVMGLAAWTSATVGLAAYGDDLLVRWWGDPASLGWFAKAGWYAAWFVSALVIPVVVGFLASRVLAAPLLDLLAERAMRALDRRIHESTLAELVTGLGLALTRLLVFVAGQVVLFVSGFVPGVMVVSGPAGVAFNGLWIFADSLQPALDAVGRRGVWTALSLFRASPARAAGFTVSATVLTFVPFAGALVAPLLVVAGALFVADVVEERSGV